MSDWQITEEQLLDLNTFLQRSDDVHRVAGKGTARVRAAGGAEQRLLAAMCTGGRAVDAEEALVVAAFYGDVDGDVFTRAFELRITWGGLLPGRHLLGKRDLIARRASVIWVLRSSGIVPANEAAAAATLSSEASTN